ncbi:MAG: hypothetical protein COB61_003520 [Thiotrichales bacterium]|nr:hypothetical protein [Thiotrichales bacterium]
MAIDVKFQYENMKSYFTVFALVVAGVFFIHDIAGDLVNGSEPRGHLVAEIVIFIGVIVALWCEISRVIRLRGQVKIERDRVARLSGELFHSIEKALGQWKLTEAESEVAIMLIKGMSMAEIGDARSVKEKTVRQHATNVYAKSGCANRNELASYFIEDLLNCGSDATRVCP